MTRTDGKVCLFSPKERAIIEVMIEAHDERSYLSKKQICERASCSTRFYNYFRKRLEDDDYAWQEFFRYSARCAGPDIWADTLRRSKQGHVKDKEQFYKITGAIKSERGDTTINIFAGNKGDINRDEIQKRLDDFLSGGDKDE